MTSELRRPRPDVPAPDVPASADVQPDHDVPTRSTGTALPQQRQAPAHHEPPRRHPPRWWTWWSLAMLPAMLLTALADAAVAKGVAAVFSVADHEFDTWPAPLRVADTVLEFVIVFGAPIAGVTFGLLGQRRREGWLATLGWILNAAVIAIPLGMFTLSRFEG